jgi:hypothetical protein
VIIPDGPFQSKEAVLIVGCDCVLIEGETVFCVKDGKIYSLIEQDERDPRHFYDLFRKEL